MSKILTAEEWDNSVAWLPKSANKESVLTQLKASHEALREERDTLKTEAARLREALVMIYGRWHSGNGDVRLDREDVHQIEAALTQSKEPK